MDRIYLSSPDVSETDRDAILRAFDSGWIAPLGPEVTALEQELAAETGRAHAVSLSSGTAALHLALRNADVGPGDKVLVQSLTFSATANAVMYTGATPVFIDSEESSWNMDPDLLGDALAGDTYKAVIPVDLYGQCADYRRIEPLCREHGVTLIEDAAESLGASLDGRPGGSFGDVAALSFNGNKIITTSGGGALVTDDEAWAKHTLHMATQARDPAPHYQHSELGFNYRMSNILAALGRSQLDDLSRRVDRRRDHNRFYRNAFADLAGVTFMPEIEGGRSSFWLTTLLVDPDEAGVDRETIRQALEEHNIETRPVWKPMHLQPFYESYEMIGGGVSDRLFDIGLCLPSGSVLTDAQREMIVEKFREQFPG
jgi:dTDP-4-amino-4,6-dideoxygalactose transaminase